MNRLVFLVLALSLAGCAVNPVTGDRQLALVSADPAHQQAAGLIAPGIPPRRIGEDDYLQRIDGLDYGENPREGSFDDNRFLHPDLAFRLDFPPGWRVQNQSRAVVAGSPQEDAIIQMTVVPGNLKEAANKFFSQQGLTAGRVVSRKVNGLPAMSLEAFNSAYPSDIPLAELAVINHLRGPEDVMPANVRAKRVIDASP